MNAILAPVAASLPFALGQVLRDVPADAYHERRLDVANNSGLEVIDTRSPAHYRYWVENPDDETETASLIFGRALHCATLEPEVFRDTYSVLPADAPRDMRRFRDAKKPSAETVASIDWWDTWEENNSGLILMTGGDYDRAVAMSTSLRALELNFGELSITVADLIDECETEVTLFWVDDDTGIVCKARADLWSPDLGLAMDLKSARDASKEAFSKAVHAHRYHVQHAHYCDGFRACGHPLKSFVFLPVEKERPYVPASYHVDAMAEELGWAIRQRSMRKLDVCLKSGQWPGHTTTVESLALPAYAFYNAQE